MTARDKLYAYAGTPSVLPESMLDAALDAHRAEVLAEGAAELDRIADETEARVAAYYGQASGIGPGSAELVREAARTLRSLAEEPSARTEGKSSQPADATPDFFQPGQTYAEPGDTTDWRFRCDSITTHPEDGERTALGWRHFRGEWEPYAYGEDDFEIHQVADDLSTARKDRA
ncbi:hypothetical protein ACIO02_35360 [Streptomyces sp. NPDC087568]|uniref:hypothetical protein n=1 Tax=Streptomyces sp. NPDC087568 TaxID=3365799 RepID=UPI0038003DC5